MFNSFNSKYTNMSQPWKDNLTASNVYKLVIANN